MKQAKKIPILAVAASLSPPQRKSANRQIDFLLNEFPGKRIIDLLPVIRSRYPETVLSVAIERVERRQDALPIDDQVFFAKFMQSLNN